ncbi:hypothetical protein ABZ215_39655 [Amycolatopsis sp. NPDC006131]|uniref:hypothetical protein n=1 Tax=unclassified Amycolatopsis TaxID=2618356 RepID=UPI0033A8F86A
MTAPDPLRPRPGVAFLGFALATGLLIGVVVALARDAITGWHAGEYTYAFIGVTFGAIIGGCLCRLARPPWRSLGSGLLLGGALGFAALVAAGVVLYIGLTQWSS